MPARRIQNAYLKNETIFSRISNSGHIILRCAMIFSLFFFVTNTPPKWDLSVRICSTLKNKTTPRRFLAQGVSFFTSASFFSINITPKRFIRSNLFHSKNDFPSFILRISLSITTFFILIFCQNDLLYISLFSFHTNRYHFFFIWSLRSPRSLYLISILLWLFTVSSTKTLSSWHHRWSETSTYPLCLN